MLIRLALALALLGYVSAWGSHIARFRGATVPRHDRSSVLTSASAGLHFAVLSAFWIVNGVPPLVGFGPASATLALVFSMAFLLSARVSRDWSSGLLALPVVALLLGAAVWSGLAPTGASGLRGPWLVVHVGAVFTGYAGLLLGSVAAAMYLLQFRALKRKEFGNVFRAFPSLESLDRMTGIGVAAGLCILMAGLLVGLGFEATFGAGLELSDPAVGFGILTWAAYAAALVIRWTPGGRGRLAALMTVVAFTTSGIVFVVLRALTGTDGIFL